MKNDLLWMVNILKSISFSDWLWVAGYFILFILIYLVIALIGTT
jgi:hypothetical protein